MSAASRQARELLDQVQSLIKGDVAAIQAEAEGMSGRIDADTALTLTRYSSALLAMSKDADAQTEDERKQLAKMTDEEIHQLAKDALALAEAKKAAAK